MRNKLQLSLQQANERRIRDLLTTFSAIPVRGEALTWRDRARPIVRQIILTYGQADRQVLRRMLKRGFPFGFRQYYPYRVWLEEIKAQLAEYASLKVKPSVPSVIVLPRGRELDVQPRLLVLAPGQKLLFIDPDAPDTWPILDPVTEGQIGWVSKPADYTFAESNPRSTDNKIPKTQKRKKRPAANESLGAADGKQATDSIADLQGGIRKLVSRELLEHLGYRLSGRQRQWFENGQTGLAFEVIDSDTRHATSYMFVRFHDELEGFIVPEPFGTPIRK